MERRSEIGTMRALGARKKFITKLFMEETLIISIIFGIAGIILGVIFVAFLGNMGIRITNDFLVIILGGDILYPSISLSSFIIALAVIFLIGIVSSLYPVNVAIKVDPVKAIQAE